MAGVPLVFRYVTICRPGSAAGAGMARHQSGPALLAQPEAVAADGHDVAVMQQPVEDRGGDNGSPNTVPHSATERFEVSSRLPRS